MTRHKLPILVMGLLLLISACGAPAFSATTQSAELPPTPFPNTPAPAQINAPLIETPVLVNIHFPNELDGWGVTETQIVRTNDGGITWYNVTPTDVTETGYSVDTFALDNNHVWVQQPDFNNYPNSGFLYHTSDGGMTWGKTPVPFSRAKVRFLDVNNGWALADLGVGAGSNAVAIYQTTDGGKTWNQTYINDPNNANAGDSLPLGGLKYFLTPLTMQTAWIGGIVYAPGTVYLFRTEDAGHTWGQVSLLLPKGAENAELTIEQVSMVTATDAYLTMRTTSDDIYLAVYVSNDGGRTWSLTPTLIPEAGSADFLSATEAVVYNGEQFYVTRDAARTWSIIPPDVLFGDSFAGMDFVNTSTGWVITLDSTNNHRSLYRTSDGGATWFPVIP